MATDNVKKAKEVFETVCKVFDKRGWNYSVDKENLRVKIGINGDDIPMDFLIDCDAKRQVVKVISFLSFDFPKEKIIEGAVTSCLVNYRLADGGFVVNIHDGTIIYRMCSSFNESLIGEGLIEYLIDFSCGVVDEYNDQFLMIAKDKMSLEEFINKNNLG